MHPVRGSKQLDLFCGDAKARRKGVDGFVVVYGKLGRGLGVRSYFALEAAHAVLELLDFGIRGQEMGPLVGSWGYARGDIWRGGMGKVPIGAAEVMARALARTARRSHVAAHLPRSALFAGLSLALPLSHRLQVLRLGCHWVM